MEKEALLWDWDELLSGALFVQSLAARSLFKGKDLADFKEAASEFPLPDELARLPFYLWGEEKDIWREIEVLYRQFTPVPPGAREALQDLSFRWRLGAQGSAPSALVRFYLKEARLNLFEFAQGADSFQRGKPDAEFYLRSLDSWGVPEEKAIVIAGASGARAASEAGIDYIYLPSEETTALDSLWRNSFRLSWSFADLSKHL